ADGSCSPDGADRDPPGHPSSVTTEQAMVVRRQAVRDRSTTFTLPCARPGPTKLGGRDLVFGTGQGGFVRSTTSTGEAAPRAKAAKPHPSQPRVSIVARTLRTQAQRECEAFVGEQIENRSSFAVETTLRSRAAI